MQTFKKCFISFVSLALCVALLSGVLFRFASGYEYNFSPYEKQCTIPNKTNYLLCGASQCEMAFIPEIIDENINNTYSYNVSVQAMQLHGRYEIIKNIISKYNYDGTVVLELSYDSFLLNEYENNEGDINLYKHFKNYLSLKYKILNVYGKTLLFDRINSIQDKYIFRMQSGFGGILETLLGQDKNTDSKIEFADDNQDYKNIDINNIDVNRGFISFRTNNVTIPNEDILNEYSKVEYKPEYIEENIESLNNIIELCKNNNINIIIVVVPLSDAFIWKNTTFKPFYDFLYNLSIKANCEFYDFNLIKSRYELFSDENSFYNETHMSCDGAKLFSKEYCKIINKVNSGEDVSDLFYSSYEEMKADSPYMKYYNSNK